MHRDSWGLIAWAGFCVTNSSVCDSRHTCGKCNVFSHPLTRHSLFCLIRNCPLDWTCAKAQCVLLRNVLSICTKTSKWINIYHSYSQRFFFISLRLTFKSNYGQSPAYIFELVKPNLAKKSSRPSTVDCFYYWAPHFWNTLIVAIRKVVCSRTAHLNMYIELN